MATELIGQALALGIERRRVVDQVATTALELDCRDLLRRRAARHHRDEGQPEQTREIGLRHCGGTAGRLHHRGALVQPAVAQRMQEQRAREAMLQAAGRVA